MPFVEVPNPHNDPWWMDHLEWMLANHPERTKDLFLTAKLKEYLDQKVARAQIRWVQLVEKGRPKEQATEVIERSLITPPDGPEMSDNPPEPLPGQLLKRIQEWAGRDFPDVKVKVKTTA